MASSEHKELSDIIKNLHVQLRINARHYGAKEAWKLHVSENGAQLKEYAKAMKKLATEHWEKNNMDDSSFCRVQWVVKQSKEYFHNGGLATALEKEKRLYKKYFSSSDPDLETTLNELYLITPVKETEASVLTLLDVGSCYNPFGRFSDFHVLPIDLEPATKDVIRCDFLGVELISGGNLCQIPNPCEQLPVNSFDIVTFSLLLEYLPTPELRWKCCNKAYYLLKPNGILFILTPDSKHATANSKLIKNWRFALAKIGFMLVHYQKLKHLHCLMYRKCLNQDVSRMWLSSQGSKVGALGYEEMICIPQDSHKYAKFVCIADKKERIAEDDAAVADDFSSLPFSDFN